jgi:hypothetical protein
VIQPKPDKPLGELVQRKEQRHGAEQQLTPMLHLGQRRYSYGAEYGAAYEVSAG